MQAAYAQSPSSHTHSHTTPPRAHAQDPAAADKLAKIQRELDETKIILHKTIESVLDRGEKLDQARGGCAGGAGGGALASAARVVPRWVVGLALCCAGRCAV